jgi:hypothetical protein
VFIASIAMNDGRKAEADAATRATDSNHLLMLSKMHAQEPAQKEP